MVARLGLRTHELLFAEIGNSMAEEVANHSRRIFTIIQNNNLWDLLTFMSYHIEKSKNCCFELK